MTTHADEISTTKLPCHRCGYDLRAHPEDGKCPECEASVAESWRVAAIPLRPAWRDSDARWRRRVLAGVWLLVLLPLMDVLKAFKWGSSVQVPAIFEVGGNVRRMEDTLLCNMRIYQMVVFCMGVVLLFSRERGRRRGPLDWTRRWGVLCSYVVSLLNAVPVFFIIALVLAGIAALCLSIPLKLQPPATAFFVNVSTVYLRYGPYPKDSASVVLVAFSSIVILLACVALFDALRSSGPKRLAAILLAPLALFSLMHLVQAGRYYFGFSNASETDIYWLGMYFQPELLVSYVAGRTTDWGVQESEFSVFLVEAAKWCIVLVIAVWLSVAQVLAWRHRKKRIAA
jgi:hypothetical protein